MVKKLEIIDTSEWLERKQVAAMIPCHPTTVTRYWKRWGLKDNPAGRSGVVRKRRQFSLKSVQEFIERGAAKK